MKHLFHRFCSGRGYPSRLSANSRTPAVEPNRVHLYRNSVESAKNLSERVHRTLTKLSSIFLRTGGRTSHSSGRRDSVPFSSFIRVSIATQFTSHDLPPSSENACSKRHEFGVLHEITNRTKIARPLSDSCPKNSPRPLLNSPVTGSLRVPLALLEKLRLHWRDSGLYRRRDKPSM